MTSYLSSIPPLADFFPPTPQAYNLLFTVFKLILPLSLFLWIPQIARLQAMGRTSLSNSRLNLPGRYAWSIAESVGPLNMLFILYTLPSRLHPPLRRSTSTTSLLGTGLPFFPHELLSLLYLLHYLNRALLTPLFRAPSMSPIALPVAVSMAIFQFVNSSCLSCWIVYSSSSSSPSSPASLLGLVIFLLGAAANIASETQLFTLRRAAAFRRAKSEGKPLHPKLISYDKVYVIPDAKGWFSWVMYPHYAMEWVEWMGYWILGGLAGLGWGWGGGESPALWFWVIEVAVMMPRARQGLEWYRGRFGRRAVGGRWGVLPGVV